LVLKTSTYGRRAVWATALMESRSNRKLCLVTPLQPTYAKTLLKQTAGGGVLTPPYGAPEHRSRNREQRASCLSPRHVFRARRVEASAASGEKRSGGFAPSGA